MKHLPDTLCLAVGAGLAYWAPMYFWITAGSTVIGLGVLLVLAETRRPRRRAR